MSDPSEDLSLPPGLRWLKGLVIVLTVVMIVGMVLLVGTLFVKMRSAGSVSLPDTISLPKGAQAQAITAAEGWYGVVTDQGEFLVFDRSSGALRQTVTIQTSKAP